MSNTIRSSFDSFPELNAPVTYDTILNIQRFRVSFETRGSHPLALNSLTLGVYPIYFTPNDANVLFDILGTPQHILQQAIANATYIDPSWNIASDTVGHAVIWTVHKLMDDTTLLESDRHAGQLALLKILSYRYFTSVVNRVFPHGANKGTMEATIAGLSNKFDIITYSSWKNVIEKACENILSSDSIHAETLRKYQDDKGIVGLLSDTQTKIRRRIVLVANAYYENIEAGNTIGSYDHIGKDVEGKKIIFSSTSTFDNITTGLYSQIQSPSRFIDSELVNMLSKQFSYLNAGTFRSILVAFCELAKLQAEHNELDKEGQNEAGLPIYIGANKIVRELIQKTYRYCISEGIDMTNKTDILLKTRNLFSSSRVQDEGVVILKRSILAFVYSCGESSRDATNVSMSILFILYVVIRSFMYL